MAHRSILTDRQRAALFELPTGPAAQIGWRPGLPLLPDRPVLQPSQRGCRGRCSRSGRRHGPGTRRPGGRCPAPSGAGPAFPRGGTCPGGIRLGNPGSTGASPVSPPAARKRSDGKLAGHPARRGHHGDRGHAPGQLPRKCETRPGRVNRRWPCANSDGPGGLASSSRAGMQRPPVIGLDKGETQHDLEHALRICRQGKIRDRTAEGQGSRMAGPHLPAAITIYWETRHPGNAAGSCRRAGLDLFRCPSGSHPACR